ncbi:ABC transporter ATP-binding protein [Kinneretia aquatilis]|uniref:ABC transporter ATP-binding protein n=1 Tax=Kinneretia aquatilis TaxID=2070761 RepID=UPI0014951D71|nr:ABC transporter ATP-binding protein [Paucibacter aquatile]WIV95802.1 ABC transporter ATP-binding protein [Paucibacter aquatile]
MSTTTSPQPKSGVSIRDLCIRFDGHEVIKGLNLEIHEGEFLVLLGPSGCGKSTLLHSIAGLTEFESIAEGTVEIAGQDMTFADPSERGIGMVFQSYALYPTMTVEKNMSFGLRVAGCPKDEVQRRVQRVAAMLQLEPLLQRKPGQLSGGQRQRVAIGRALVREAAVLLFDEPLSNLDAKLRAELRRELKLLHKKLGSTMIYVTHDQVEAMTLASRIVVMKGGVIQQIGAPTEVYERPANLFVAGFLGAPGMNLVPGQLSVSASGEVGLSGALSADLAAYPFQQQPHDGQAVLLGIRPEHVRLDPQGAWRGVVHLIEPMGNHQVVWIQCGAQLLAAIVEDHVQLQPDQALSFQLDLARASLFDQSSEQRL